ncbi:uncharacterized protein Dere_GG13520, isoform B [Drosophila erecta]|uniref:Uncharacterized protein, isoform B n=1 Tax=Drosophila erecta TaxID=7220 RepID=A0A0Q5U5D0_DROER|nr:uncharacterized protein Dere_GG13520, isoform B [Drosophila erecta]
MNQISKTLYMPPENCPQSCRQSQVHPTAAINDKQQYTIYVNKFITFAASKRSLRASADDMRAAAQQTFGGNTPAQTNDRAGIVNNAQPFSFTGAVGTDSNV